MGSNPGYLLKSFLSYNHVLQLQIPSEYQVKPGLTSKKKHVVKRSDLVLLVAKLFSELVCAVIDRRKYFVLNRNGILLP